MKLLLSKEEVAKILVDHFFEASPNCNVTAKITPHGDAIAIVEIKAFMPQNPPQPNSALQEAVNTAMQHASDPLDPETYEEELQK